MMLSVFGGLLTHTCFLQKLKSCTAGFFRNTSSDTETQMRGRDDVGLCCVRSQPAVFAMISMVDMRRQCVDSVLTEI